MTMPELLNKAACRRYGLTRADVDRFDRAPLFFPGAPPITIEALQRHEDKFGLVHKKKAG